jgi:hypothetical protein
MIAGAQMVTRTGLEAASFQAVTAPDEASRSPERGSRQPLDAHPRLRARPTRPHAPAESPRLPRTSKRSADSPPRRQPRATSRSRTGLDPEPDQAQHQHHGHRLRSCRPYPDLSPPPSPPPGPVSISRLVTGFAVLTSTPPTPPPRSSSLISRRSRQGLRGIRSPISRPRGHPCPRPDRHPCIRSVPSPALTSPPVPPASTPPSPTLPISFPLSVNSLSLSLPHPSSLPPLLVTVSRPLYRVVAGRAGASKPHSDRSLARMGSTVIPPCDRDRGWLSDALPGLSISSSVRSRR